MSGVTNEPAFKGLQQPANALKSANAASQRPERGWLRATREGLGLSQASLAKKLGMSRQSYAELETAEARGAISLKSLQRAAEAMACELVYFVRPRVPATRTLTTHAQRRDPKPGPQAATKQAIAPESEAVDPWMKTGVTD